MLITLCHGILTLFDLASSDVIKNTVVHPRVQMAFCLQGMKMDDEIFIMDKNDARISFFPIAFLWEIFYACFDGQRLMVALHFLYKVL